MNTPQEGKDAGSEAPRGTADKFRRAFLLTLVAGISLLFFMVVHRFLMVIFIAAILAGLLYPGFRWLRDRMGGRGRLAAGATVILLFVGVGVPLAGFLALVVSEALHIGQSASAWLENQEDLVGWARGWLERLPLVDRLIPDPERFSEHLEEATGRAGTILLGSVAAATRGTAYFALQLLVLIYALFYFFVDGPKILDRLLGYLPFTAGEKERLMERFVSVTKATLKGSLLIGLIQGGVAGAAFWVAGVPAAAFWGTMMVVLSIIPAVGAAIVWIPTVIYMFTIGETGAAIALGLWCGTVVSLLDNVLRPRFIGRDAKMSDLMILISTLGGIALFGALGFIVGPITAALFVAVWHIYGEAFRDWLPDRA